MTAEPALDQEDLSDYWAPEPPIGCLNLTQPGPADSENDEASE